MTELSTVEVLRRVRDRIATPDRWTKGKLRSHRVADPDTCPVCLEGAVRWAVTGDACGQSNTTVTELLRLLRRAAGMSVVGFNDSQSTTHADVLAVVDRAIALAEADQ